MLLSSQEDRQKKSNQSIPLFKEYENSSNPSNKHSEKLELRLEDLYADELPAVEIKASHAFI